MKPPLKIFSVSITVVRSANGTYQESIFLFSRDTISLFAIPRDDARSRDVLFYSVLFYKNESFSLAANDRSVSDGD